VQSTSNQTVSIQQRNYIQGLRGLAILAVVFYHANLWVHGGFVGVDIFFVISGYVIFNSLINEYSNTNKIDIGDFVSRRVRRLLPAFSVMSICTLIATVFILSPFGEQQQVSRTSQAASLFGANIYLAIQNSYFALVNNPFRHTWTLAVEEQFYLFLILFLALLVYVARRQSLDFLKLATIMLIIFGIASFAISTIFSYGFRIIPLPTRVAFFSFPTRTWEFIVGILVALSGVTRIQKQKNKITIYLSTTSGILLIIYALVNFNTFTNFPGLAALFPVVGTALLYGHPIQKAI
jgi:peptidoglycan/LPS O-acetylase OafA/YrhL